MFEHQFVLIRYIRVSSYFIPTIPECLRYATCIVSSKGVGSLGPILAKLSFALRYNGYFKTET